MKDIPGLAANPWYQTLPVSSVRLAGFVNSRSEHAPSPCDVPSAARQAAFNEVMLAIAAWLKAGARHGLMESLKGQGTSRFGLLERYGSLCTGHDCEVQEISDVVAPVTKGALFDGHHQLLANLEPEDRRRLSRRFETVPPMAALFAEAMCVGSPGVANLLSTFLIYGSAVLATKSDRWKAVCESLPLDSIGDHIAFECSAVAALIVQRTLALESWACILLSLHDKSLIPLSAEADALRRCVTLAVKTVMAGEESGLPAPEHVWEVLWTGGDCTSRAMPPQWKSKLCWLLRQQGMHFRMTAVGRQCTTESRVMTPAMDRAS